MEKFVRTGSAPPEECHAQTTSGGRGRRTQLVRLAVTRRCTPPTTTRRCSRPRSSARTSRIRTSSSRTAPGTPTRPTTAAAPCRSPLRRAPNGPWTIRGDAMPGGPSASWAQPGRTWAPDVYPNPTAAYTLTYTAWHKASGRQCIGVATATSPLGPFTPVGSQPLICPLDQGGAIDANTFVANDGTRYLRLEERRQRDRPALDALAHAYGEQRHRPWSAATPRCSRRAA